MTHLTYVYPQALAGDGLVQDSVRADEPSAIESVEADRRWDLLLVCIAGYMLTAVGRIHQLFPVLEMLRPAFVTGLVALYLYYNDHSTARRATSWPPATKYLLALLFWMVLATPNALVRGTSLDKVIGFAKTVAMFFVIAGAVRGPRDIERLAAVYLASATLFATIVILRFDMGSGDQWRLGSLYYYDANDLATFIVTALPFCLYFLHAGRNALFRLSAVGALGVLTLAFVRTGSRGGFIALLVVAAMIVVGYSAVPLRWRLGATVLAALVLLGTASETYWKQMNTTLSDADYNRTEETGRLQIWSRGIGYTLSNPILGVGPGNFQAAEGLLSPFANRAGFGFGVRWNAPHNSYLQMAAELGIPGLLLYVVLLGTSVGAMRRLSKKMKTTADAAKERVLAQALSASLVGFMVGSFFLSLAYSEMLYTLIALTVALQRIGSRQCA